MKDKIKTEWNKHRHFLIAPLSVTVILLVLYAIKGIYPFGKMTIANGDMGQAYMTFYTFLYDVLENGKSIFYEYTLGMGSNIYGGFISDGLLNPSNLIILLNSRENIPYMFSYILIIKIAFIALTSYILFNKLYKENKFYNVIFSIIYALSGYVLMYNTNIMWLDVVGLFPLFILAIKYMFETDKIQYYSIILALMLILNYNLSYMVLMFIIFVLPVYIRFGLEKEKRKRAVFNIIIGTILSVGLSAFAFIPAFTQVMQSYRMSGETVNTVENINILFKIVIFIFYALPIYGYIQWIKNYKKDKKNVLISIISITFTAILPILFERVNLLWHTGSYQMFPFRYGFIPLLIIYMGALEYFAKYKKSEKEEEKRWNLYRESAVTFTIGGIIIGIYVAVLLNKSMPAFCMPIDIFFAIALTFILIYLAIKSLYNMENEKAKNICITVLTIIQVFTYSYAYVGVDQEYRYGREWSDEPIFTSYQIAKELNIKDNLYRIKDLTALTTENCPLIYDIPSMSTFLHIISTEQVLNCKQLGYSNNNTKINDYGGTIFSDAIYGIKYVLTKGELSEIIYNYVTTTTDGIKLYEYKNNLPIGITYNSTVEDIPKDLEIFDAQNYLYKRLFNKQDNIIEKVENSKIEKKDSRYKYIFDVVGTQELYINIDFDDKIETSEIKDISINGKKVVIPITNDEANTVYPVKYCNGILDLGTIQNEQVEIEFTTEDTEIEQNLKIGLLDIEKYNKIFSDYNNQNVNVEIKADKIKVTGCVENDTKLLLPINYDKGWKVVSKVNNDIQITRVCNNFIGLELKKGDNEIELQFRPYLYDESLKITFVTILIMVAMYFIEKRRNIRNIKFVMNIFYIIGIIIYIACLIKIYIISIIKTFI